MSRIFQEFENENAQRTYPFAAGCHTIDTDGVPIGTGILIDAAIYPVNSTGPVYLSKIENGMVFISDDTGIIMAATHDSRSDSLEFYETKGIGRHTGTVLASSQDALDILMSGSGQRTFSAQETSFASSCVFPIENDGVLSLEAQGSGVVSGEFVFSNTDSDPIRISTDGSGKTLRFDILPHPASGIGDSIEHIYCIVDGKTPFRIYKYQFQHDGSPSNTIAVYLDNIDRSSVCGNAHREDSLVMADTCGCSPEEPSEVDIPPAYQAEVVDIPNGADSAFYLAVPNLFGYDNPLSLTLDDGDQVPKTDLNVETDSTGRMSIKDGLSDETTPKGVIFQVPGLGA